MLANLGVLLAAATLVLASAAAAQDAPAPQPPPSQDGAEVPPDTELVTEARAAFEQGVEAFRTGRPVEARIHFERSFELLPTGVAAWNLAQAHRATGDPVAALALIERMLAGELGPLPDAQREAAELAATELRGVTAVLRIRAPDDALEVAIDGEPVGLVPAGGQLELRVVGGVHSVVGTSGERAVTDRVSAEAGSTADVTLRLPPPVARSPVASTPPREEPPEEGASPWLAVGITAGALLVAGAVVLTILALGASDPPEADPVWGNTEVLR